MNKLLINYETVAGLDQNTIQELLIDLLSFADFKYGIGYQRDYAKGPEWYPFGYDEDDPKERWLVIGIVVTILLRVSTAQA